MAQDQQQWAQAERYYQQALQIYVEFNDRYHQASTYHQLGMVAQGQRQWAQSREYFIKALEIGVEYKDEYRIGTRLESLARLWQASGDDTIPATVARVLNVIHGAGNIEDHIHIVASIPPKLSVADCIRHLKGASSHAVNLMPNFHSSFKWQEGYGAISISERSLPTVIEYAKNQKQHHRGGTVIAVYERMTEEEEETAA